ncbi:MAG: type 4a pilus biogenesis protein PilO [Gammaproteobacteria bacterium]
MIKPWHNMPQRQFYLLLGGIVAVIIALVASAVAVPQFKRLRQAQILTAPAGDTAAASAQLAAAMQQRDAETVALSTRLHGDRANLPAREIEAFVIDRLNTNAWEHDVALQSVVPRGGDAIEHFRELVFELTLTGGYQDLFRWLHALRDDLGFVVIKELHMTPTGNQTGEPILQAEVTLASYRRESS